MDNVCGFLPYCKDGNCADCDSSIKRSFYRERKKHERDEQQKLETTQKAEWKADVEKRKLEFAERKALKIEREELAKESKSRCVKCFVVQGIEGFRITPSTNYPDRRAIVCIECDRQEYLKRRGDIIPYEAEKAIVAALLAKGMQFCKKCGIEKEFNKFTKSVVTKGIPTEMSTGYNFVCRDCINEREQKNRESRVTPEQLLAREQRAARGIEVAKEKEEKRLRVEQREAERAHPDYKAGQHKKVMEKRKSRMKTDPAYRIKITLRSRIRKLIKGKAKVGSHIRDLGCSVAELKIYLESKFKRGMTWENHGKVWHIDHIIALSTFDLTIRAEYLKAVHYTNLQPLTIKANLEKGNGHIDGQQFCLI